MHVDSKYFNNNAIVVKEIIVIFIVKTHLLLGCYFAKLEYLNISCLCDQKRIAHD
jgi:hypothetical protein